MLRRNFALASIVFALCTLAATDASAAAQRTFVASTGNDANPCSRTLPCRAFAAAILQTVGGGEVIVLDSAGYGPVTINQSVSIIAPDGIYAGISVPAGQDGLVVNGGDIVVLRGLSITGLAGSEAGISILGGTQIHIERCVISKMGDAGIRIDGSVTEIFISDSVVRSNTNEGIGIFSGSPIVFVKDTRVTHNGTAIADERYGIFVAAGRLTLDRVTVNANGRGLGAKPNPVANVQVAVRDSDFSEAIEGLNFVATTQSSVVGATVERSTIRGNTAGIFVQANAVGVAAVRVTDSVLSGNDHGVHLMLDNSHLFLTANTFTGNVRPLLLEFYDPLKVLSCGDNRVVGNAEIGDIATPIPCAR